MKRPILIAALFLASCVSTGHPATVGMSLVEFEESCGQSYPYYEAWGSALIGECPTKPDEYVWLMDDTVHEVLTSAEIAEYVADSVCDADDEACRQNERAGVLSITKEKQRNLDNYKRQRIATILGAVGSTATSLDPATNGTFASPDQLQGTPVKQTCFLKEQTTDGANRICHYDCVGSWTPISQPITSVCLPTAQY